MLRGFYDSSLNALIQHHSRGSYKHAHPVPGDAALSDKLSEICGRCAGKNTTKTFETCRGVVIDGQRLLNGSCTNCFMGAAGQYCSMTGKF
jgi:hypothetical protein